MKNVKEKLRSKLREDFFEFLKHSKNYVSADLFIKGLSIISIPIFTRLLVPSEYGVLAIFFSFVAIFVIISGLGVRGAVTRYYYEKTDDFDKYYGSNIIFIILWGLLLSLFLFISRKILISFFAIPITVLYLGIVVAFFCATFEIYQAYLQASKHSKKIARLNIFKAILGLILAIIITVLLKENRYYGIIIAQIIVVSIFFVYSLVSILKISKINFTFSYVKYSLLFGIPVVFHLLSQYVLNSFDLVIINQLVGTKETGLYSFAYKVGMLQNIISMGMLRAWSPIFYEKLNSNQYNDINNLAKKYAKIVYLVALTLILFSREFVIILADKKYYASLNIVPIVVISYVFFFLYTMYVNYAFYYKKTYLIAVFTIIAGSINIGLNYLLIPKYGYQAAAWTTLISYACLFVLHYFNVRFIIKPEIITRLRVLLPNFFGIIGFVFLFCLVRGYVTNYFALLGIKLSFLSASLLFLFGRNIKEIFYK
ncbi:MAG: oligosaccharide flippase family protein [Candidatus Cloacimonetes bacterium]|nr:oligosaccharide flippase family protein [Candidatus Cloacimonadota bacterium]